MEQHAIAILFGQPVNDIPKDLFIPPDALQVILKSFEGPLDLLLYLIRKQNLDVLDIPMEQVTNQYLQYIATMENNNFDLAAEYLLMAATLIEIKSRLLLPQTQVHLDEEDDPRAELARRLLAYEQMKQAALKMNELPQAGRDFDWVQFTFTPEVIQKLPEVSIGDLKQAWLAILSRSHHHKSHTVQTEKFSVRHQMLWILQQLKEKTRCIFHELFEKGTSTSLILTNFIAILELVKENQIFLHQEYACGPITITAQNNIKESYEIPQH